jgi:hypothetical protein
VKREKHESKNKKNMHIYIIRLNTHTLTHTHTGLGGVSQAEWKEKKGVDFGASPGGWSQFLW